MKTYAIETASQEFTVSETDLDGIVYAYCRDGYQVLNDDTGTIFCPDESGKSPTMVFRAIQFNQGA